MRSILLLVLVLTSPLQAQDTTVVRSRGPGIWGDRVRLVEELRIGQLEGADEYLYGDVEGIVVGRDGTIIVADDDGSSPVIRAYDAQGRFLRNIGRPGSGPGEYRTILGMRSTRNGGFAVWDPRNSRINVYDAAGKPIAHYTVQSGLYTDNAFAVDTAGFFYVKAIDRRGQPLHCTMNPRGRDCDFGGDWPIALVKVSSRGEVVDSLSLPASGGRPSFVLMPPEGTIGPFTAETTHAWSPHGYVVAGHTSRYAITLSRPGRPLRIERGFTPVRVAAAEKSEWEAWRDHFNRARNGSKMQVTIPATKPVFRGLDVDEEGRIWVDRYVAADKQPPRPRATNDQRPQLTWREPRTFDVFDPDGRFLGTVRLPARTFIYVRRGLHLWGTQRGEMDETYIVRFRIQPSTPARAR